MSWRFVVGLILGLMAIPLLAGVPGVVFRCSSDGVIAATTLVDPVLWRYET